MTSTRAPRVTEDPLAALPIRPDGAMTRELASDGSWQRVAGWKPPVLRGVKGEWHGYGYSDEAGWSYSFGWPDDMRAVKNVVLYRTDRIVGYLWFYDSPSAPDLHVLFVYRSMIPSADAQGEHMGEHDFCWWGTLR